MKQVESQQKELSIMGIFQPKGPIQFASSTGARLALSIYGYEPTAAVISNASKPFQSVELKVMQVNDPSALGLPTTHPDLNDLYLDMSITWAFVVIEPNNLQDVDGKRIAHFSIHTDTIGPWALVGNINGISHALPLDLRKNPTHKGLAHAEPSLQAVQVGRHTYYNWTQIGGWRNGPYAQNKTLRGFPASLETMYHPTNGKVYPWAFGDLQTSDSIAKVLVGEEWRTNLVSLMVFQPSLGLWQIDQQNIDPDDYSPGLLGAETSTTPVITTPAEFTVVITAAEAGFLTPPMYPKEGYHPIPECISLIPISAASYARLTGDGEEDDLPIVGRTVHASAAIPVPNGNAATGSLAANLWRFLHGYTQDMWSQLDANHLIMAALATRYPTQGAQLMVQTMRQNRDYQASADQWESFFESWFAYLNRKRDGNGMISPAALEGDPQLSAYLANTANYTKILMPFYNLTAFSQLCALGDMWNDDLALGQFVDTDITSLIAEALDNRLANEFVKWLEKLKRAAELRLPQLQLEGLERSLIGGKQLVELRLDDPRTIEISQFLGMRFPANGFSMLSITGQSAEIHEYQELMMNRGSVATLAVEINSIGVALLPGLDKLVEELCRIYGFVDFVNTCWYDVEVWMDVEKIKERMGQIAQQFGKPEAMSIVDRLSAAMAAGQKRIEDLLEESKVL